MASIAHEHLYIASCGSALLSCMHVSTKSTRARVGKSFARASVAPQIASSSRYRIWRSPRDLPDRLAALVDERDVVLAQDCGDGGPVVGNELVDGRSPFRVALPHAHCDRIVELDARFRTQRNHGKVDVVHALGEVPGDGTPDDGRVDPALCE